MKERDKFELTGEILSRFLNGQLEVQNLGKGTVHRGKIIKIELHEGVLSVEFAWLAQAIADGQYDKWVVADDFTYRLRLSDKVRVQELGDDCIMMSDPVIGDVSVLYPESRCRVTTDMIEGLDMPKLIH